MPAKVWFINDKLDFIKTEKTKNVFLCKKSLLRGERSERVWGNLSWHINKWFVSEYKYSLNSTVNQSHKQNNPIRKWANDIIDPRRFTEEDINITNKH